MSRSHSEPRRTRASRATAAGRAGLGPALRRAWVGYQRRVDEAMAAAGFGDRRFPDGRVLRMCQGADTTISDIGRELGITRQGASKIVADLRKRRYVRLRTSSADAREKIVRLTPRAGEYLDAQTRAARAIERQLRTTIGGEAFDSLFTLLDAVGADEELRMRDYLRQMGVREI